MLALLLAAASPAPKVVPVFRCALATGGKVATAVSEDGQLVYRFGRRGALPEIVIRQSADPNNVWYREERMAAPARWLRFARGQWSYILDRHDSDPRKDVTGNSGLTVMRGTTVVASYQCRGQPTFSVAFHLDGQPLPEDALDYSPF